MAVSVECDGDASVAQALADDFRMNSAGKKQAGVRVPHIMESHGCQARAPYPGGEPLRRPVGRNWATKRVREDETPVVVFWTHGKPLFKLTVPEPPQRFQRSRAERYRSVGLSRLGLPEVEAGTRHVLKSSPNRDPSLLQVDIFPLKGQHLPQPQSTVDSQYHGVTQKAVFFLADLKPEAAYFLAEGGKRTAFLVIHMNDASELPAVAEPWFLAANASIEATPVMLAEDLERAGPSIEQAVKKYG